MNEKIYEYDEIIHSIPEKGGAYVIFRGISEKNSAEDGSICYIIGITKAIRAKINKGDGDQVHVIIKERE